MLTSELYSVGWLKNKKKTKRKGKVINMEHIYGDDGFYTFKDAAAEAIAEGRVDEWLDSFTNYDDYQEASDAVDEVNTEWYRDAHMEDLPNEYK